LRAAREPLDAAPYRHQPAELGTRKRGRLTQRSAVPNQDSEAGHSAAEQVVGQAGNGFDEHVILAPAHWVHREQDPGRVGLHHALEENRHANRGRVDLARRAVGPNGLAVGRSPDRGDGLGEFCPRAHVQ
jgi:hypothetical protein